MKMKEFSKLKHGNLIYFKWMVTVKYDNSPFRKILHPYVIGSAVKYI